MENNLLLWIILCPLISSVVVRLFGKTLGRKAVHWVASGSVLLSFALAVTSVAQFVGSHHIQVHKVFLWLDTDLFQTWVGFQLDSLSCLMVCIITGVGSLIHIYSTGYMAHEKAFERYFAYLNLFMAMMLTLVLADNALLMFVGWEGVGLCSYLLIGFYYSDHQNADAGKKAFVVNRVGDFAFIIGLLTLFWTMGIQTGVWSFDFQDIKEYSWAIENVHLFGVSAAVFVTLMMFIGATGKSAQIPLYVWLPDAMAGPTPVSALIHAATMVTSGIYLISRLSFLFDMAPATLHVIAWIGGLTALFAATIALVQNDIKKVLAYSTVSQLGYMFLACGVGAYASGMFHVTTHAFFKALLFLAAGSVIHACHHEQDMRKMGQLKSKIPSTYKTYLIGAIAISGVFPFAGFFSKDEILWQVWNHSKALWIIGLVTAGMTAFYMFRSVFLTFWGDRRMDDHHWNQVHESPASMTAVLWILAGLSLIGGWVWWPGFMQLSSFFPHWLESSVVVHHAHGSHAAEISLTLISLGVALSGIALAYQIYVRKLFSTQKLKETLSFVHRCLEHKYYVDEAYEKIWVQGTKKLSQSFSIFDQRIVDGVVNWTSRALKFCVFVMGSFDRFVVDGLVNLSGYITASIGLMVRKIQNGQIQLYLATMLAACGVLTALWVKYYLLQG
ncbi:MAG: NADH-quinone oxidoreductase subunit L [Bdellovibrionota bacterium]